VVFAAAPRAKPVFDGGERLTGWTVGERNGRTEWTLDLPDVAADRWFFRSLFVNGRRAPRARLPKFSPDEKGAGRTSSTSARSKTPTPGTSSPAATRSSPSPATCKTGPRCPTRNSSCYTTGSRSACRARSSIRAPAGSASRAAPRFNLYEAFAAAYGNRELARYYVDNLFEALTEPGEWYLNRETGRLYYLPRPGETPANTAIHAPRIDTFIRASGEFFNDSIDACDAHATPHLRGLQFHRPHLPARRLVFARSR
jgi:hypothetical protein